MQLSALIQELDTLWPRADAADWDRPGLMIGSPAQTIDKVMLSVDVTAAVIEEAIALGADLLLTHHPMFLRGVFELGEDGVKGANAATAIRAGLAIFSAHTNADYQENGVSRSLARAIGLEGLRPLIELSGEGVFGELRTSQTLLQFATHIAKSIPAVAAGLKVAGDPQRMVSRVGLVGGAGDSYLSAVQELDLDVFITSDLRHHPSQDFIEQSKLTGGPALIDISHWAAEWVWLDSAKSELNRLFPTLEIIVSDLNTDPWTFAVMQ
ncbi:MAG: hypothetical protein RL418_104 [Actinomycetota bacterium]